MKLIDCRLMEIKDFEIVHGFHPTNALFYITNGSFSLVVDGKELIISKGDLVSFPDNMEFERRMIEPITLYNVRYVRDGDIFRGKADVQNHTRLLTTLSYMAELSQTPDADEELMDYYLGDIFMQLKTEQALKSPLYDGIVADAVKLFERRLDRKLSIDEVAEEIGISVSGLIGHFKQTLGTTPMRYLSAMRIKKAEEMLVTSGSSIAQIAAECGFDNAFYFSNAFKKEHKICPSEYKKKYGV